MRKYIKLYILLPCLILSILFGYTGIAKEAKATIISIPSDNYLKMKPHVSIKKTKKVTTKKKRMKKVSHKSSTKIKEKTKKSKVKKKDGSVVETIVTTTIKTIKKKKKRTKTIQTITVTTVKTTTYSVIKEETFYAKNTSNSTIVSFRDIKGKVDSKVYQSFNDLGFSFKIDPNLGSTGVFSVRDHWIKIKTGNPSYLYHELGHFVAALKNKADKTAEFQQIYDSERGKYTGNNKSYVTKDCSEYFAESFRDYTENAAKLKKERPDTFQYINKMVSSISNSDIIRFKNVYGWYWRLY